MIQFMLLSAALVSAILAGIVIANNASRPINRVYALLSFSAALWLLANALVLSGPLTPSNESGLYLFIGRLITPSSVIVAYLLALFMLLFVYSSVRQYVSRLLMLALPGAVIVLLSFTELNVFLGEDGTLQLGALSIPFAIVTLGYLSLAFHQLFFKLRHRRDSSYTVQAKYLRRAFLMSVIPSASFGVVLPLLTTSQISNLGPLFSIVFLASSGWLIVRHKLFDVRPIVARVIAYALLLTSTVGFFGFFAIFLTRNAFDITNEFISQQLVPFGLAVVIAFLLGPLKRFFDRLTNRLFFQDAYDPQVFLDELNKTLVSTVEITLLLSRVQEVIERNMKVSYVAFIISGTAHSGRHVLESGTAPAKKELEEVVIEARRAPKSTVFVDDLADKEELGGLYKSFMSSNISAIAQLTTSTGKVRHGVGELILGNKKSGSPLNGQDRKVLQIVVSELVIAIQNALRFEEIQQFNVTLQDKIDQATRKLRKTNERLRLLDQTKDDFISMASHQLRTPLTSVKGYVSMVLDGDGGKINETQRKLLTQSFLSSQRMVYLISDLLNVSRLRTGKFVIEPVESNLDRVIEEELDQLTETVKSRGLELKYHKPEHFPTLMLDETKIRQVIMNFVDNAIYYTPTGGHIDVYLADRPDSIEFTVVDDGIGVPKHEQHHLFSKFYRAKNAQNARPDGTGLGIFMAKKVIIAQGGAIVFKSAEGKGSTFGFTFPKAKLLPAPAPKIKATSAVH